MYSCFNFIWQWVIDQSCSVKYFIFPSTKLGRMRLTYFLINPKKKIFELLWTMCHKMDRLLISLLFYGTKTYRYHYLTVLDWRWVRYIWKLVLWKNSPLALILGGISNSIEVVKCIGPMTVYPSSFQLDDSKELFHTLDVAHLNTLISFSSMTAWC